MPPAGTTSLGSYPLALLGAYAATAPMHTQAGLRAPSSAFYHQPTAYGPAILSLYQRHLMANQMPPPGYFRHSPIYTGLGGTQRSIIVPAQENDNLFVNSGYFALFQQPLVNSQAKPVTSAESFVAKEAVPVKTKSLLVEVPEAIEQAAVLSESQPDKSELAADQPTKSAKPVQDSESSAQKSATRPEQTVSQLQVKSVLAQDTPFAAIPTKVETLSAKPVLFPKEQVELEQAMDQVAVVESLKTDPETMRTGLLVLSQQVQNRIDQHPQLSDIKKSNPTPDIAKQTHTATVPLQDALSALSGYLSNGVDTPQIQLMEFLVAELFDAEGRQQFFEHVEAQIQASISNGFVANTNPSQNLTTLGQILVALNLEKKFLERFANDPVMLALLQDDITFTRVLGRQRAFEEIILTAPDADDEVEIDPAGASSGSSDHTGAGANPQ